MTVYSWIGIQTLARLLRDKIRIGNQATHNKEISAEARKERYEKVKPTAPPYKARGVWQKELRKPLLI